MATTYASLKGKRVFMISSATGVGAALATAFAEQGAMVSMAVTDRVAAKTLADQIADAGLVKPGWRAMDATNSEALAKGIEQAVLAMDGLDILVAAAADLIPPNSADTAPEQWRDILSKSLDADFHAMRLSAPFLVKSRGLIINVTPDYRRDSKMDTPAASAAISAVQGLTRALSAELAGDGVRVNAVLSGAVGCPMGIGDISVQPQDVANLVMFLAASESAHITGQSLSVGLPL